ncbi:hypothetical protein Syn7502_00896 [Synechococcus sp. PCC 7502]|uniref:hypothetical protein n=1 Tax=Synechococcus sp. PCC 7502 TaxID=1173263 RepID=UPI00029FE54A|nr:hypothetical protein [Synechococcus sp. PCC 7502]AFY73018.1 hypothetical protein Syn7502_00896 [Synechococcus sp. PCC 7502]
MTNHDSVLPNPNTPPTTKSGEDVAVQAVFPNVRQLMMITLLKMLAAGVLPDIYNCGNT